MKLSHSSEASSRSAIQEIPNSLWNPNVYYRIKNSPPLVRILIQINLIHAPTHPISLISIQYYLPVYI
jgi:hypothetical protein